jgi:hypothetical protein
MNTQTMFSGSRFQPHCLNRSGWITSQLRVSTIIRGKITWLWLQEMEKNMRPKKGNAWRVLMATAASASLLLGLAQAESLGEPGRDSEKPNPLKNVYFGEQHLHTQDLPDAYAMGTRNTVDDAYNFAKGKAIKKNTSGEMVQKKTPYDMDALGSADHLTHSGGPRSRA